MIEAYWPIAGEKPNSSKHDTSGLTIYQRVFYQKQLMKPEIQR